MKITLVLVLLSTAAAAPSAEVEIVDAFAVVAAMDRFAEQKLWPGFDPRKQPVAIFDGEQTLLLRHPSPPEDFDALPDRDAVYAYSGRHSAMRWNSTALIGDVPTATLLLTIEPGRAVNEEASILLHETFHLWSKPRHPGWRPNEVHRYSYPMDDLENYRRLLLEEETLARAMEAETDEGAASWAGAALAIRADRHRSLEPEHLAFETALEMQEGTAVFLARSVLGTARDTERLRKSLPPDGIRWRCYEVGAAMAAVLERLDPQWKTRLEAEPDLLFSELLTTALASAAAQPATFTEDELAAVLARAEEAVNELEARRTELEEDFASRPNRVVVELGDGGEPFEITHFDPMAIEILDDSEALQAHGISLTHAVGTVDFENTHFKRRSLDGFLALSTPAGRHPFLDGIRRVAFAGFPEAATVRRDGDTVIVEATGLTISIQGAEVERGDEELLIRVPAEIISGAQE